MDIIDSATTTTRIAATSAEYTRAVAAAPNTTNVIPGVLVLQAEEVAGRLGEEGFDDLGAALRVYVPGDAAAQATVRVIPEGDALTGASFDLVLNPGVVTDVPIEGLVDGSYSVIVEANVPIVTAMRVSTVAAEKVGSVPAGASDVAWFAAATPLSDSAYTTIASGPGASLHLVNPGDAAATVTVGAGSISVPAGASVTVEVNEGESLSITGAEGLFASVSLRASGRLASYLVTSAANSEQPVTVYPG